MGCGECTVDCVGSTKAACLLLWILSPAFYKFFSRFVRIFKSQRVNGIKEIICNCRSSF